MKIPCPHCGKKVEYEGNPYRPFCSERCRLIDLGKWLNEEYRIPAAGNDEENVEDTNEKSKSD